MATNYKQFTKEIEAQISSIMDAFLRVPWHEKRAYGDYLAQTFYYVSHATRVLALAAARCRLTEEPMHKQFLKGIQEEKNHEILALRDLHIS